MKPLSKSEVHKYMSMLTVEQQEFLNRTIKQYKKSKWLEILAKNKGISITKNTTVADLEKAIDDWVLIEVLDSGYGSRDYQCICGKSLRYKYVVFNKKNREEVGLGIECFKNHTNLSPQVVKDVIQAFHKLDLIRDEILVKVVNKQVFDMKPYLHLENIPATILEQAKLSIPLTDKQISILQSLKNSYDKKMKTEKILTSLKPEARKMFEAFSTRVREEIVQKMLSNEYVRVLPDGFRDTEVEQFISNGFPLLNKHLVRIHQYKQLIKSKKEEQKRREEEEYWRRIRSQKPSIQSSIENKDKPINYQTLIERHLTTLQTVRKHEKNLTVGMANDWIKVQDMVRRCKNGQEIDYSSFKLNLSMICHSIKVEYDQYL